RGLGGGGGVRVRLTANGRACFRLRLDDWRRCVRGWAGLRPWIGLNWCRLSRLRSTHVAVLAVGRELVEVDRHAPARASWRSAARAHDDVAAVAPETALARVRVFERELVRQRRWRDALERVEGAQQHRVQ